MNKLKKIRTSRGVRPRDIVSDLNFKNHSTYFTMESRNQVMPQVYVKLAKYLKVEAKLVFQKLIEFGVNKKRAQADLSNWIKVADYFNVTLEELLDEEEEDKDEV